MSVCWSLRSLVSRDEKKFSLSGFNLTCSAFKGKHTSSSWTRMIQIARVSEVWLSTLYRPNLHFYPVYWLIDWLIDWPLLQRTYPFYRMLMALDRCSGLFSEGVTSWDVSSCLGPTIKNRWLYWLLSVLFYSRRRWCIGMNAVQCYVNKRLHMDINLSMKLSKNYCIKTTVKLCIKVGVIKAYWPICAWK
jgi:hypothetical protein